MEYLPTKVAEEFGINISILRGKRNITIFELAEALGVDETVISNWECGKSEPDLNMLVKVSKYFNVSIDFLLNNFITHDDSVSELYDDDGNLTAGILVYRDLKEKLQYEDSLNIKSQYVTLNKIVENLDLCFARYTFPDFDVIECNNKTVNLIKQINNSVGSQLTLKEFNIYNLIPINKNTIESICNSFNNNDNYYDVCKYSIFGKDIYYKYIYQPLYGTNNEVIEVIVLGIDVTKDVKSRLKMEKALKIQDEIYSNVSHELKTPLSVIFSANQIMDMYLKNYPFEQYKDKIIDYNNIVKQNCYRLTKLINNIVDMSKNNTGNFRLNLRNENIVEIVENIVQSVTEYVKSRELKLIFDTDVEEQIIACDALQIERVMLNLISNSIKFSNPNSEILVNVYNKNDKVQITVQDEGVGIDQKHLAHIFQRYYQVDKSLNRNAEGCGIGLSLTKHIVDLHGGKIYAKSKLDKGSTFIVELPIKTVEDSPKNSLNNENNKVEMIRIEFSDIYNI